MIWISIPGPKHRVGHGNTTALPPVHPSQHNTTAPSPNAEVERTREGFGTCRQPSALGLVTESYGCGYNPGRMLQLRHQCTTTQSGHGLRFAGAVPCCCCGSLLLHAVGPLDTEKLSCCANWIIPT